MTTHWDYLKDINTCALLQRFAAGMTFIARHFFPAKYKLAV